MGQAFIILPPQRIPANKGCVNHSKTNFQVWELPHIIGIKKFPTFEKQRRFQGCKRHFLMFYGKTDKSP
jgi:hypothetical protein